MEVKSLVWLQDWTLKGNFLLVYFTFPGIQVLKPVVKKIKMLHKGGRGGGRHSGAK